MPGIQHVSIQCYSIDQAHFQFIRELFKQGRIYINERGSFEGHKRLEFGSISLHLTDPGKDTIPMLPDGVPPVSTLEGNQNYCALKLLDGNPAPNETYTYGEFIASQLPKVIKMLKETPDTNQAVIQVGNEHSIDQDHPPCLRLIDFRVQTEAENFVGGETVESPVWATLKRTLHMFLYFRSWDLWGGLPENLGGLRLLQEYVASELGIEPGEIIAHSKGLHLYDTAWPVALMRLSGNMPENSVITKEEAELGENWMRQEQRGGSVANRPDVVEAIERGDRIGDEVGQGIVNPNAVNRIDLSKKD